MGRSLRGYTCDKSSLIGEMWIKISQSELSIALLDLISRGPPHLVAMHTLYLHVFVHA